MPVSKYGFFSYHQHSFHYFLEYKLTSEIKLFKEHMYSLRGHRSDVRYKFNLLYQLLLFKLKQRRADLPYFFGMKTANNKNPKYLIHTNAFLCSNLGMGRGRFLCFINPFKKGHKATLP